MGRLACGRPRGLNYEHMQLLTDILQRHWEWQEERVLRVPKNVLCQP